MLDQWAMKRLYFLMFCVVAVLGLLTFGEVSGHLSPHNFAIAAICFFVGSFTVLAIFFYKVRARNQLSALGPGVSLDAATRKRLQNGVRALRRIVMIMPVFLIIGLWETKGEPLLPRFVGSAINIWITTTCFFAMRKTQARLKEPQGIP
jgi:hypothetical protein